ncbi:fimbrial biogenesis chaperone [Paraburkholderia acidisoli]|uniref:Fimbria/pilus periplasmic chaperone n=1 Tax=Paraburkholderia acidisoli TaxID=2571748 RepID=A0A7Z2GRV3_9BURK|nr:molecular chaperone [Paraburkholderia acidisoli]QGZ66783.1 fimbria/pilus periplasmic chaperone [Paraburkholderia acidisoli]
MPSRIAARCLFVAALALGALAAFGVRDAQAATLQISPVTIEFSPGEVATGLTLRNPGETPVYGQVRVFRWSQANGDDVLTPATDVIASPPLIEIAPHADQLVRLVRTASAPPAGEESYRLLIDELPPPGSAAAEGVTIRLRYSVPVFVDAANTAARPVLAWHLVHAPNGWALRADNTGARRAQIAAVQLVDDLGQTHDVTKGLLGYALAGQGRQWHVNLPPSTKPARLTVRATVNTQPLEAPVTIDASGG